MTSLIDELTQGVVVAEVSSFQLETVAKFHPDICGLLNITPDHLDRHKTMDAYIKAKSKILRSSSQGTTRCLTMMIGRCASWHKCARQR